MKFKCPKCGTIIEGQPDCCPSCGVKFKWKKPEEKKEAPTTPVVPRAPRPFSSLGEAEMELRINAIAEKYKETYPSDVISEESLQRQIFVKCADGDRNPDEEGIIESIHSSVVAMEEARKAEAEKQAAEEAKAKEDAEIASGKKKYYLFGLLGAIFCMVFSFAIFYMTNALGGMSSFASVWYLLIPMLLSVATAIVSLVRLIRCAVSMGKKDFESYTERQKNKKKPFYPAHRILSVITYASFTAATIIRCIIQRSYYDIAFPVVLITVASAFQTLEYIFVELHRKVIRK